MRKPRLLRSWEPPELPGFWFHVSTPDGLLRSQTGELSGNQACFGNPWQAGFHQNFVKKDSFLENMLIFDKAAFSGGKMFHPKIFDQFYLRA